MKKPIRRIHSFLLPSAMWLLLFIAVVMVVVFAGRWDRIENPSSGDIFAVAFCSVIMLFLFVIVASYRLVVDEKGVTVWREFRKTHIPWDEVRSVTVRRLVNGWRMIYISKVNPPDYAPQNQQELRISLRRTVSLQYSKKRIGCIRQYWSANVPETDETASS